MAEDHEKKFHSIMGKLFSSALGSSPRGKKRMHPMSISSLVDLRVDTRDAPVVTSGVLSESAPLCRPWDRGDLLKRLATFKSITWFAKPKVVSAVNCARRGWINVDMDTLACESCGVHLLFTTPTSWSRQQVEKAASVFSLKLDSGHKFLCSWSDNACDERLAEFPPTPPHDLAQMYEERISALSQLSSLPVTFISTLTNVRDLELGEFLKEFVQEFPKDSLSAQIGNESPVVRDSRLDAVSARLYNQAKKLIALCGWELRVLPYVVDCKAKPKHHIRDAGILSLSDGDSENQNSKIDSTPVLKCRRLDTSGDIRDSGSSHDEPDSVVLHCRLCGATVGLWTFSLVSRPSEVVRLIGSVKGNSRENTEQDAANNGEGLTENFASDKGTGESSSLSCTIAGGPPPRRQNFKATISVPVIGQNLRYRIHQNSAFRRSSFDNTQQSTVFGFENDKSAGKCALPKVDISEIGKELEVRNSNLESCMNAERSRTDEAQETDSAEQSQHAASIEFSDHGVILHELDALDTPNDSIKNEQGKLQEMESSTSKQFPEESGALDSSDTGLMARSDENCFHVKNNKTATKNSEDASKRISNILLNAETALYTEGNEDYIMFDPIYQHRHFCPWIVSINNARAGWQQTLSALKRQKQRSDSSPSTPMPSSSWIQVDDPITSVRNLFKSPLEKRSKGSHSSPDTEAHSYSKVIS